MAHTRGELTAAAILLLGMLLCTGMALWAAFTLGFGVGIFFVGLLLVGGSLIVIRSQS